MSTTSGFNPWEVYRGDQWAEDLELFEDEDFAVAVDLTDAEVAGEITWDSGSLSLTEGNGRIVVPSPRTPGRVQVRIDEADNVVVPLGQLSRRRLWMIDDAGDRWRVDDVWVRVFE